MFGLTKNFHLNPGGILGAVLFVLVTVAIAIALMQNNLRVPAGSFKFLALSAFGGSLFGNWLWRLAFGSDNWEPPPIFEVHDPDHKR
jgi:hypothetical protein